ncbi:MAG: hypothetical protein ABL864_12675 [Terricaulis sp.]
MVSSIVPGNVSGAAGSLGADARLPRPASSGVVRHEDAALGDRVELSAASLAAVRDSVRAAVAQVQQALAIGHDAQTMLVEVQSIARNGGGQDELDAVLQAFTRRVEGALDQGARLIAGEDVSVQAEPGGAPLTISGVDLRLKDGPGHGDIFSVSATADAADRSLPQAAQRSLDALQTAMGKLLDSARALEAHQGFLGAVEGALAGVVRNDLDADGARLLALQVRQGLEGAGARPIANAEPQAVLALFRA